MKRAIFFLLRSAAWLALVSVGVLPLAAAGFIIVPHPMPIPREPNGVVSFRPPATPAFTPLEVTFHHVNVKVRGQVAVTAVDEEFYNPNDRELEGTYIFPVPKGAQIDQFSMDVNGRQVDAELLSAEKARQIYEDIVRQHRDPALLEYVGRDVFKVRIFPIEPRSRKHVKLSYTQVLVADAGIVRYRYPLNTEKFSAKPIPSVSLKLDLETREALKSIYSPSHAVEINRHGDRQAIVGFELKDVKPATDFELVYATAAGDIGVSLLTQTVPGDDGYFMLLVAPAYAVPGERTVPKDVTFVLDTSGSMAGKKLEQARKALEFCVANLNDDDRFQIIRFATDVEPLFDTLTPADRVHRDRATAFIQRLQPTGGTAIYDAMKQALGARPSTGDRPYLVIFLTDGLPTVGETSNDRIVEAVKDASHGNSRVFCFGIGNDVNTHLLDRITEATRAASAYVLPEEDIELKVSSFFAKVKDPVLASPTLSFPDGVRITKLYPSPLPDVFKGDQLVLVGRFSGAGRGPVTLAGSVNGSPRRFDFNASFAGQRTENEFISRLWATRRVGYLLDEIRLRGETAELRDEVTALARQHGIVTPYTAYLIHEDEQRRGIPLAQQSLPAFSSNAGMRETGRAAYRALQDNASGAGAVAAARYGLAQKSANQAGVALDFARVEAGRAVLSAEPAMAPEPRTSGGAAPSASFAAPATAVEQVVQIDRQSRYVGGRTFFQNGNQWVDSEMQKQSKAKRTRLQFGTPEYFNFAAAYADARPWLALGANVQFVLGDTVYEVVE